MTAAAPATRQVLVSSWVAQMIGTLVLCGVVTILAKNVDVAFAAGDPQWKRYAMAGILLGAAPALAYLRWFKQILDQDLRLERERGGTPDPAARVLLRKSLIVGGALCEIPMAMGVLQLFFGGEMRWFLGATFVTIALRLSYRPFNRKR
jgi:hypothetical protein